MKLGAIPVSNLVNLTPHEVNIYGKDGSIIETLPECLAPARAILNDEDVTIGVVICTNGEEIPVRPGVTYRELVNVPEPDGRIFLVSLMTGQAMAQFGRSDFLLVHKSVRDGSVIKGNREFIII